MMPDSVEKKVANRIGMNTSVGFAAPCCARYTIIEMGISVSPLVLSTKNIIIAFVARSLFGFSSCNPSIAFSPSGVAALSSPNIFAERFIKMLPTTGCPSGISGKRRLKSGPSHRANIATTPPFSPMRIMPIHSDNTPVSPREISKAVLAVSKVDAIMLGNTSVSPKKSNFTTAMTKAMRKKANQM